MPLGVLNGSEKRRLDDLQGSDSLNVSLERVPTFSRRHYAML